MCIYLTDSEKIIEKKAAHTVKNGGLLAQIGGRGDIIGPSGFTSFENKGDQGPWALC